MFERNIYESLRSRLFKGKLIVLYGPRQVGKTTLVKKLLDDTKGDNMYLTGDDIVVRSQLSENSLEKLKSQFSSTKLLVIDEAQKITNIGNTLKLLVDNLPTLQVVATGSSSFDLANKLKEPLTGRYFQFFLYPLSLGEIITTEKKAFFYQEIIQKQLIYGSYPEVYKLANLEARERLELIASDYLYKDILELEQIKSPSLLQKILQALALQLGNEVSTTELANLLNTTKETVSRYLDLLEKAFIVFRLRPFSRNLRKELGKMEKVYFYDLGIRNSLIGNFNPLELRQDVGSLWENYAILERKKYRDNSQVKALNYFWRTYDQQEIDLIEERDGRLFGFEFKYNEKKTKNYRPPKIFLETYKNYNPEIKVITPENCWEWLQ